jgi:hypothetical protein
MEVAIKEFPNLVIPSTAKNEEAKAGAIETSEGNIYQNLMKD